MLLELDLLKTVLIPLGHEGRDGFCARWNFNLSRWDCEILKAKPMEYDNLSNKEVCV